jgi:WD40 repeat protein
VRPAAGFWVSDVTTAELAAVGDKRSISTPDKRRSFHGPTVFERSQSGGEIKVRDLRRPDDVRLLAQSNGLALDDLLGLSPRERFVLARGTATDAARVWDLDAQGGGDEVDPPSTSEYGSCEAQSISDNRGIAWYCTNRDLVLVTHPGETKPVVIPIADGKRVESMQFGANGLLLAMTLEDFSVRVFDSRTGQLLQTMKGHHGRIGNIAFSRDDSVLLSVSDDSTARMWDIKSSEPIAETTVPQFTRFTRAVASPNGLSAFFLADDRLLLWRCYACGNAEELQNEVEARKINRIPSFDEITNYRPTR